MAWSLDYSLEARTDLALIYDFLFRTAIEFGSTALEAEGRVIERMRGVLADIDGLKVGPHRGTLREHLAPGLRSVTMGRAIVWFSVEDVSSRILVVGVFYGGQDHIRHMTRRLHKPG